MSAYEDTVRGSLSHLEDDELISRLRSGGLTEEAQQIVKDLLEERGLGNIIPAPAEPTSHPPKETDSAFLSRCFRGAASLGDAFWVLGISIWLILGLPIILLSSFTKGTVFGAVFAALGALVLFIALVFRDISIWRCAPNAKVIFWGVAARIWVGLSYGLSAIAAFK